MCFLHENKESSEAAQGRLVKSSILRDEDVRGFGAFWYRRNITVNQESQEFDGWNCVSVIVEVVA